MELETLIPKDKFDSSSVVKLYNYSFEELKPIIPKLMEWLQDGHWPIAIEMANFLKSLPSEKLAPYILEILNGNDYEWKYFMIHSLASENKDKIDPKFLKEIIRIANNPTDIEIEHELHEIAKSVLK